MSNPFEEISQKLDAVLTRLSKIEEKTHLGPTRIPFPDYCKQENITRPTGYNRADRGLIKLEKVGGRQYVLVDSITLTKKYQREIVTA